ncbi:MAG: proline dehydrogenase, partial [Gemmatimonadetes bacterium]|nr:proline dehydrogenase [Gemmatimonadota bacterium]NIV25452.1 proline dehydrogenase [Gemmatimonadota bacterium]NIW75699.1 proline dehydrogenase [Gemmatimonadota bacterium]NIY37379.1 proline dehydrogenase [Gemmatimonadota bacterium]NIY45515.1 proline dehydrogenase [Gemmatimonadota bacterium]
AIEAAERLAEDGIASVLTYLGENVSDRAEADRVTAHYRDLVDRVDSDDLDLELSIKLTQLGLDLGDDVA